MKQPEPKTVELVKSSYQPTKSEKQEDFNINASMEELADAVLSPVSLRWTDNPQTHKQ